MAILLANTFVQPSPPTDGVVFPAVGLGATHRSAIALAGVRFGYPDGAFQPGASVTRREMASLLDRALALPGSSERPCRDSGADSVPADSAAAAQITEGCALEGCCATDEVTRGQLASLLFRAVHR